MSNNLPYLLDLAALIQSLVPQALIALIVEKGNPKGW